MLGKQKKSLQNMHITPIVHLTVRLIYVSDIYVYIIESNIRTYCSEVSVSCYTNDVATGGCFNIE